MSPLVVLVVAVLATSYAGPIVRFAVAPALAIAFWRLALVLPVTGALALWERRREPSGSDAARAARAAGVAPQSFVPLMVAAGILLGLHFWAWIASLRYTSVASSVVLVSLRPVFAWGMAALWLGEVPRVRERWGIVVAVLGAVLIGAGDARASRGALAGDLLALGGALAVAGYVVIGRRVRRAVGVWSYVSVVYAVAAAALALVALGRGTPLVGFGARDWTVMGALAAGPMLIGHTGMNYALKHLSASTVNVAALGEPVGASVIAWLVPAIHEVPAPSVGIGAVVVLAGIVLALGSGSARGAEAPGTGTGTREPPDAG
jgi:drug/metabolite transporter (DMT)-like permease